MYETIALQAEWLFPGFEPVTSRPQDSIQLFSEKNFKILVEKKRIIRWEEKKEVEGGEGGS